MTFGEKVTKFDQSLPGNTISLLLAGVGVIFILVALFADSNILKATLLAYAIVP